MASKKTVKALSAAKVVELSRVREDMRTMAGTGRAEAKESALNYSRQIAAEKPSVTNLKNVFTRCDYYGRESSFIRVLSTMRNAIINYGYRLKPSEAGKGDSLKKWMETLAPTNVTEYVDAETQETIEVESTVTNGEAVQIFVRSIINEAFLFDNIISYWTDSQLPITLDLTKCDYTDIIGIEKVKYTHGLTAADLELLPEDSRERFKKATIILNPAEGDHFKVFKRCGVGEGLSVPSMFSIFRTLGEVESKEFGMNAMAFFMRTAKRVHQLGYEVKGPNSGKAIAHTMWQKRRSDAVKKAWVDIVGVDEYTCNFDEKISFPWPDLKVFDDLCWKGSDHRLYQWAGPIGQMVVARGTSQPWLSNLVRSYVMAERADLATYIERVINLGFKPPTPIKIAWSNTIFNSEARFAELIKFAYQAGLASVRTGGREIGLDSDEEMEQKLLEANDKDAVAKMTPMFDMSHGTTPALGETTGKLKSSQSASGQGGNNGRPAGQKTGAPSSTE